MPTTDENMIYLFHAESIDQLDSMEESLLYIQDKGLDKEHINSVFRAVHTIKGGAAIFSFKTLVDFSHIAESLLGKIREDKLTINNELITIFLDVKDQLNAMIENIIQNDGKELYDEDVSNNTQQLLDKLLLHLNGEVKKTQAKENLEPKQELQEAKEAVVEIKKPKKEPQAIKIKKATSIKIEADKIDNIINLLGEVVITTAGVKVHSARINDKGLKESVDALYKILEELREASMKTRMVPIGQTFNRYKRVVRDLSLELDKDVELVIVGGDTELDKTIIEKISDPIMHLVRNALDHAIESKEERQESNKSPIATITLSAAHESGNIIIRVKDDGRGLNKEKIINSAIEKDLIKNGDNLSEREIYRLIFKAGFSTAKKLTDISGRGVGMDVVKQNIEELRGSVEIESANTIGTTITIRLPLTLAIIDGFMVKIASQPFIIPLEMIQECIELTQENRDSIQENKFIKLREHILPILDLRTFFGYSSSHTHRENIVVVYFGASKIGLIVDELLGEFQTVIKPMSIVFKNLKGIGGATILGDGKVSPILDIPALLKYANENKG